MVNFCAVVGCSQSGVKGFFRIPAVPSHLGVQTEELSSKRRKQWLANIARTDLNSEAMYQYRVCSKHFLTGAPSQLYDVSNPDWAPTQEMNTGKKHETNMKRYSRNSDRTAQKRMKLKEKDQSSEETSETEYEPDEDYVNFLEELRAETPNDPPSSLTAAIQTDLSKSHINHMDAEINRLRQENLSLTNSIIQHSFTDRSFYTTDEHVKYFTGLPNTLIFFTLFHFLEHHLSPKFVLTKFQQVLLVLMRMRLNIPLTLLSHIFQISNSTSSRIYNEVVNVMYIKLKPMIVWPDREQVRRTMPMCFRRNYHSKITVVIDCFEIFVERPSGLKARAQTWSSYKHNNTVKYLIGIVPQGVISFISSGWGGRASDKHITENCGFLRKIFPGDVVMADRGFDIAETLGTVGAELFIPAFTRGKLQLPPVEVENTRKLANVRIHVECVIGNLRQKYTFLDGVISVDHLFCPTGDIPLLDKEVTIACALINMNNSVVPFD